ncbi:5'-nucleotidase C-terminal domain-containing protein [Paenibacillus sp. F411]|nr:5'-nucleotidase C-terminal domain-containing protein [Paenibacillus sp. F411]MBO2945187.1 5'-nucleotidase C-terminal domain-containing protein [Paenibacillus sp. F411]
MKLFHRKWLALLLSGVLMLSNLWIVAPQQVEAAPGSALTVAQAIAGNSGTATVEGYIVGHATGSKTSNFTAPFGNDYNVHLGDAAGERDPGKLLNVQVSSGYRSEFGLQSNPELIGKKIKVTGQLALYNNFPGLKSPTEMVFAEAPGDPGDPGNPGTMSIAAARALHDGEAAIITGVAITKSGAFGSKGFYVQDDTAGIYVQQQSVEAEAGSKVTVSGIKSVDSASGEVQLQATTVQITGTSPIPAPVGVTPATVSADTYGQLVKLTGVTAQQVSDEGTSGSFSFYAAADGEQVRVFVDFHTGLAKNTVQNGQEVHVTGVVTPFEGGLQIKPSKAGDIRPALTNVSGKKILFDNTHGQTAGAADWVIDGAFSDFADGLKDLGFTVDQLERTAPFNFSEQAITLEKLQEYDVFIIGEANIPFKASEQDALLQYAQNGGSIFFIGDHYNADRNYNRWDSTEVFNGYRRGAFGNPTKGMTAEEAASKAMEGVTSTDWLGTNFGIRFRFNALGTIESGQTVVPPSDAFGITEGVSVVESHAGGTLAILNPKIAKGLIYMPKNAPKWGPAVDQGVYNGGGIDEGPYAAIAKVGAGKAAFIGDSSPVEDITPKYRREDSGAVKKTYNGFLEEGDNSEFLLQTVEWLAVQEDYTTFEGRVELSPVTPLLSFETPAASTEPQQEPWSNPTGGYKWYNPATFAPGSYGSGQAPPEKVEVPGITSIAEARKYPVSTTLTVEGVITTTPGSWGAKGFYIQDATGGIYMYQNAGSYALGQKVQVTGDVNVFSSELQLSNISQITVTGNGTLPQPKVVSTVDESHQGQVVKLNGVSIQNIVKADNYGTLQFNAVKGSSSTLVRIDNRTGVNYNTFTAQYKEGDVLDLTGIASVFNGTYQLKPRSAEDVVYTDNASEEPVAVELIGLNDLHGKIDQHYELDITGDGIMDGTYGGAEYMAAYIRQRQQAQPNTLFVGVGDLIGGSSPVSALFQDEPTVEILDALDMAVNTAGNHEFDEGTTELLRMVNGGDYPHDDVNRAYGGMEHALLAANVVWRSGESAGESILPAYHIEEVEGQRIGFIGVVTEGAAEMVMPSGIQDIEFTNPVNAINKAAAELKEQGVRAIIVLAHSAASQDAAGRITGEAADYVNGIDAEVDVIFAAHNHAVVNGLLGSTLIVQASEYGKALSRVKLSLDPVTGDIAEKSADILWVDHAGVEPDPEVSAILDKYEQQVAPLLNEVVGTAAIDMEGGYAVKGEVGDNALGNLIADSMAWAMESDFAMMNGGGIRDQLNAGEITFGELFNILPFNNVLVKLEIQGSDLVKMVNAQMTSLYGPDFSISGFKYTWDGSTAKVVDITLPDGSAIDADRVYTLTVNNYMSTSTGAKYKLFGELGNNPVMGPEDLEALVSFIESFKEPIRYEAEGRISEVGSGGSEFGPVVTIGEAKLLEDGAEVTVEGVVSSKPGAFGSNHSFYLQDDSGGIQVYTYENPGVSVGDRLKLKSQKSTYRGAYQLNGIAELQVLGQVQLQPQAVSTLTGAQEYELVTLQEVKVEQLSAKDGYGNFSFKAVRDGRSESIYVDSRTGITYEAFKAEVTAGDVLHITGIVVPYNGSFQLKPRSMEDFADADATAPDAFLVGSPVFTDLSGKPVTALQRDQFIQVGSVMTNQSGAEQQAALIIALYDSKNRLKNVSYVEKKVAAGQTESLKAGFSLPNNVKGYVIKVMVWDSFNGMKPLSEAVQFPNEEQDTVKQ